MDGDMPAPKRCSIDLNRSPGFSGSTSGGHLIPTPIHPQPQQQLQIQEQTQALVQAQDESFGQEKSEKNSKPQAQAHAQARDHPPHKAFQSGELGTKAEALAELLKSVTAGVAALDTSVSSFGALLTPDSGPAIFDMEKLLEDIGNPLKSFDKFEMQLLRLMARLPALADQHTQSGVRPFSDVEASKVFHLDEGFSQIFNTVTAARARLLQHGGLLEKHHHPPPYKWWLALAQMDELVGVVKKHMATYAHAKRQLLRHLLPTFH
eukprot:TRINITY_DN6543_c0_g2_i1.p1 TRINITY_DN6543_c0_g2~~TRINITY_DN6543_c0_g2_i1.p1  ORF type:complete len:293 (+),score=45.81 TRINITY_DN6543_c0_g2_i1:88-879(+)